VKKTINLIEQRTHKHEENKSEYNWLINLRNRKAKKYKEEWLGHYGEEIENLLNQGNTEKSYNLIRKLFGKAKIKSIIIKSKEGKTLIEYEKRADRWQQNVGELYNYSEELEEVEWEVEITSEELGPPITKSEFERALNELK